MPTYEYECKACGHAFERFQSITARPVRTCPKCAGEVTRLISAGGGLLFKGSGFYETDHRSAEYKRRAKEESGAGSGKGAGKSPGKTEGKGDSSS